jgi:hypothetical protein
VHTLGRPPRRLVLLHLDGSVDRLPAVGAAVTLEDRQVGFVGSSARHHELGPVALGLVSSTPMSGCTCGRACTERPRAAFLQSRRDGVAPTLQQVRNQCGAGCPFGITTSHSPPYSLTS